MNRKVSMILSGLLMAATFTGCYSTADGRMRAGIPLIKDQFESRYERPVPEVFAAAREVLQHNGTLTSENTINNSLQAKVDGKTVIIRVDEVEPKISRIIVQARSKSSSADLDLASEIDKQIALRLRR
jgi:hypothetical protein